MINFICSLCQTAFGSKLEFN